MDEPHEGYKMVRGVRIDIKKLLTNFEKTGSVRFSTFCEEWKRMKFSLIFCQRRMLRELLEYCEEVIHIAKSYLEPPWSFPIRAGALFTLYGLYFKQPIKNSAKIRFTKEEWQNLLKFIQECKEAKHFDICFIHYKLFVKGAYIFTAIARATGFERGYRKYNLKRRVNRSAINETILKRPNIIEPEVLQELSKLESLYQKSKTEVLGKKNLDFVDSDFTSSLINKLSRFYKEIQDEYPAEAIEETLASANKTEEPQPSCSTIQVENRKPMTIHEKTLQKIMEKSKGSKKVGRKSNETDEEDDGNKSDPVESLSLPNIM